MKLNSDALPLLELVNEGREDVEELEMSHLNTEMLHGTRSGFVLLLIEAVDFYIKNPTKSTAFHAARFYRFDETLVQKTYDLFNEFNILVKSSFPWFTSEKFGKAPDEGRSIMQS